MANSNQHIPNEIVWHTGMDLCPQHFQQSFQRQEGLLNFKLQESISYNWGVRELVINEAALTEGMFEVQILEAKMEDGLEIFYSNEINKTPLKLDLSDHEEACKKTGIVIDLLVPIEPELLKLGQGKSIRYKTADDELVFDNTTEDNPLAISRWKPRLMLQVYEEDSSSYLRLPLVKISFEDVGYVQEPYIPPIMAIKADRSLNELCAEVPKKLREKALFLSEKTKAVASLQDKLAILEIKSQIQSLVSALPQFETWLSVGETHPLVLYAALTQLAGSVAAISPESIPPAFPPYHHHKIHDCFSNVVDYIIETITIGIQEAFLILPFKFDENEFEFSIPFDPDWPTDEVFIGVRGEPGMTDEQVAGWTENSLIGSASILPDLRKKRLQGLKRVPTQGTDSLIPMGGVALFELLTKSEHFKPGEELVITNPADKLPGSPRAVELLLYVEAPERSES